MKPTVSYVRGLRDVLEFSREERRDYILRSNRKFNFTLSVTYVGLITGAIGAISAPFLFNSPYETIKEFSFSLLSATPIFYGIIGGAFQARRNILIERAGRAHQGLIRNGTTITQELEREAFNNVI